MKAIVQREYGAPLDVLSVQEVDKPAVTPDKVLVRVRAVAAHAGDWGMVRGVPYLVRPSIGLIKPKNGIVGTDIAGLVEEVGENVNRFQPGDEVFGTCTGGCGEYACAAETELVPKPPNVSFEQAAAIPTSAFTALQGLRDTGELQPGQKVLIVGASGGVGTFAVRIAKALGAEVTGVCSSKNVEMVRSIGADHVIDYTQEDFSKTSSRYDLILDMAGNRPLSVLRSVLHRNGILVLVGGRGGPWLLGMGRTMRGLLLSPFVSQRIRFFVSTRNEEDLTYLKQLLEDGTITPVIDTEYVLDEGPAAIDHVDRGHTSGKVVIRV